MGEALGRVALAGVALAIGLGIAWWGRAGERRRLSRADLDLSAFDARVLLFTAERCSRCERARRLLRGSGMVFREVAFELEPERFRGAGVGGVPLLVVRDESGAEMGRLAGRMSRRSVRRLLATG
ncbi:MAG: hypothetical protein QY307_03430 [Acidimicrobiia bacterium]|nr:MAG: hypothetical protein QY307_03430 [Acidimicrobiia bacterium]